MAATMQQQATGDQNQVCQPAMAQQIPQQVSQQISQQVSQQIPQQISQQIPQQISQQIPQHISQQIPQQISQQIPQQMVLCPVRVVYETQILMPPDQMQPNQSYFINPQNQPPWAHNRQMTNQVIYLQHAPNNIIQSMPQQMEQNQFYLQQPYQQIVQHSIMPQNQENAMRTYQMPNVITTNMIQNVQSNIGTNFQTQLSQNNDPSPNYGLMNTNVGSNIPITQSNTIPVDRQDIVMHGVQNQNVTNQKQMYINIGQQTNQQAIVRPQLMTMNPMQQTSQNVQMIDQARQVQNNSTNTSRVMQRTFVNAKTNTQPIRMRTVTLNNVAPTNLRTTDQNYACRPIKPRPEYRPHIPSFPNPQVQIPQVINTANINPSIYNKLANPVTTAVTSNDTIKITRKRKSESPDELTPKLTIVNINTTIAQPLVKSIDVGINTSPVHKPNNYTLLKSQNNEHLNKILPKTITQDLKSNIEDNKTTDTEKSKVNNTEIKPDIDAVIDTKEVKKEDNKLVRYTVFPQSRVRVKEEAKVNVNILKDTKNIINPEEKNFEHKIENSKILLKEKILSKNEERNGKVEETLLTGANVNVMNNKESPEHKKEYVLTHVLDGLVIQESNIAFPIRDSTKKSVQTDTKSCDRKREVIKVDELLRNKCLELPITERLQDKDITEENEKYDSDVPFANLNAATVKRWTMDQLTSYLSKYKWDETVSLLQDHEIDGESLFLVTKPQLLHIGIKEKHADIICEYAKS